MQNPGIPSPLKGVFCGILLISKHVTHTDKAALWAHAFILLDACKQWVAKGL